MYDIAIIGLGPAGSTLARLIDKRYKVVAIDKKNSKLSKCCGGLLSPDAQKILAKFDVCLPKDVLVDPQIFSVRTIDLDNDLESYYQRFYINMNRSKFDKFLISLIPNNVTIHTNSFCHDISKIDNGYNIIFSKRKKEYKIQAKIIIGADGANGIVRNTFFRNKKIKQYIAIQEWYPNKEINPFYSCIFDKKITNSYCWTISKDNSFIIGGAFPIDNSNERFELLKEKVKSKGITFSNKIKREGCLVNIYSGWNSICTGKNNVYLLGEAAGMISPSSLEGISYAMDSASVLAKIINNNILNISLKYYLKTLKIRIKLLSKIFKKPFMYNKYLRNIVMRSKIKSINKS